MKLLHLQLGGRDIPIIEDDNGKLMTPRLVVQDVLGMSKRDCQNILSNHHTDFEELRARETHPMEFLREHRTVFGIQRVRDNLHMCSVKDMMSYARWSTSTLATQFIRAIHDFALERAPKLEVDERKWNELVTLNKTILEQNKLLERRLSDLEGTVASAAGSTLNAHKARHLRLVR